MSLDASLEAHTQLAECCQPSVRSLDHPAVAPEPVIALDAPASDAVLNAMALEMVAAAMEVVALVSVHALGPASWPARQAPNSGQVVDELFEDDRVVPVGSRDTERQWMPTRSVTTWRLLPSLPRSVGLGPVCGPPGDWVRWPHRCSRD